jgi:hypothetical protein
LKIDKIIFSSADSRERFGPQTEIHILETGTNNSKTASLAGAMKAWVRTSYS